MGFWDRNLGGGGGGAHFSVFKNPSKSEKKIETGVKNLTYM